MFHPTVKTWKAISGTQQKLPRTQPTLTSPQQKYNISANNRKVVQETQNRISQNRTCWRKEDFPLNNECQQAGVNIATIQGENKFHKGTSNNFKNPFSSHSTL